MAITKADLAKYGIANVQEIMYNPTYEELFQAEMDPKNEGFEKGVLTNTGCCCGKNRHIYRTLTQRQILCQGCHSLKIHFGGMALLTGLIDTGGLERMQRIWSPIGLHRKTNCMLSTAFAEPIPIPV